MSKTVRNRVSSWAGRGAFALALLAAPWAAVSGQADQQREFMITDQQGRSRLWVLSADWRPEIHLGILSLANGATMRDEDVISIRPKRSVDTLGYRSLVLIHVCPNGRTLEQEVWIPARYVSLEHCPSNAAFWLPDDRTWVRKGVWVVK